MLSSEDRTRIEEEERKRVAEEQFRAEIRSRLKGESTPTRQLHLAPWILLLGLALVAGAVIWSKADQTTQAADDNKRSSAQSESKPAPPAEPVLKTRYIDANKKVASGQIVVKAGGFVQYRVTISPEMIDATLTGTFNATGGRGNDIEAVIADEPNFSNWINGHQAQVFWGTPGKQTTGDFTVKLAPATYYLVFSNKFSALTDKQVFLEVDLSFRKTETYYE